MKRSVMLILFVSLIFLGKAYAYEGLATADKIDYSTEIRADAIIGGEAADFINQEPKISGEVIQKLVVQITFTRNGTDPAQVTVDNAPPMMTAEIIDSVQEQLGEGANPLSDEEEETLMQTYVEAIANI